MILAVDASVAIKWFFRSRPDESHVEKALAILAGVDSWNIELVQPPHFVAEVAAVLAREKPDEAAADLEDLLAVEFRVAEDPAIYKTAAELSIRLNHHLFDTLYHATALHTLTALYITADRRYYEKAKHIGRIYFLDRYESA